MDQVPIIKWDDRTSGIPLNICIGQKDGIANTEWCVQGFGFGFWVKRGITALNFEP